MTAALGRYLSFDSVADVYDATRVIPAGTCEDIARLSAETAGLRSGGLFLDAGVGTGRFAAPLGRRFPGQIVGADISLPMMRRAEAKAAPGLFALVNADLQRLPFRAGAFRGALIVHILHLIERWTLVIDELRRVLLPHGVLLLGSEQGGRSLLVDFYYTRARKLGVLKSSLGAPGLPKTIAALRSRERISAPYLTWKRSMPIAETLRTLRHRTYSQMWAVPEDIHNRLLAETEEYALRAFGDPRFTETLDAYFLLYAVRWS
jgi:ubiquinone/menaquinone biosynthesis C-methylase UbiE